MAHWPNASVSGRFEPRPSAFIRRKTGDSLSFNLIQIDTPSRIAESRNGMRQPSVSDPWPANSVSPIQVRMPSTMSNAMNRPTVAVVWIHDV